MEAGPSDVAARAGQVPPTQAALAFPPALLSAANGRKRPRSSPGIDGGAADMFQDGLFGRRSHRSPVSDPDIDFNAQSNKRYLSEVMANNLTTRMHLRRSGGGSGHMDDPQGCSTTPQYAPSFTPPGGCSPARTGLSEMSEGGGADLDALPAMMTSEASGKASGMAGAESTSETAATADSGILLTADDLGPLHGPGTGMPALAWSNLGYQATGLQAYEPGLGSNPFGSPAAAMPTSAQRRISDAQGAGMGYPGQRTNPYGVRGLAPRGQLPDAPTSPSDSRYVSMDLRKTALLRSFSKRTEDMAGDFAGGNSNAATGAAASTEAGPNGDAGASRLRASHSVTAGTAIAAPPLHMAGGGDGGRHRRTRSDSVASEGMSEGGVVGMETSSTSGDHAVAAGGGVADDALTQVREGSGEARLTGSRAEAPCQSGMGHASPVAGLLGAVRPPVSCFADQALQHGSVFSTAAFIGTAHGADATGASLAHEGGPSVQGGRGPGAGLMATGHGMAVGPIGGFEQHFRLLHGAPLPIAPYATVAPALTEPAQGAHVRDQP